MSSSLLLYSHDFVSYMLHNMTSASKDADSAMSASSAAARTGASAGDLVLEDMVTVRPRVPREVELKRRKG